MARFDLIWTPCDHIWVPKCYLNDAARSHENPQMETHHYSNDTYFFQVLVDGKFKASYNVCKQFSTVTLASLLFSMTHTHTLKVDVIAWWATGLSRILRAMDSKVTRRNSYSFYTSDGGVLRNCTLTPNCANSANSWKCVKFNHHHKASILSCSSRKCCCKREWMLYLDMRMCVHTYIKDLYMDIEETPE